MRHFIITFFVILSFSVFSQKNKSDVIYPIHGNDSIANCHIIKIKKGNLVIYNLENKQDTIEAIAVVKKGRFIDFRNKEEIQNNAYPILNSPPIKKEAYSDLIYLNDGSIIKAKITNQNPGNSITYKTKDESHNVVSWDKVLTCYIDQEAAMANINLDEEKKNKYLEKGKNEYAGIGLGIGSSYGGVGAQFQFRVGKTIGLGGHAGIGLIPESYGGIMLSNTGWKIGLKFYYFKYLYANVSYGTVGTTYYSKVNGLSFLLGGDFIFSKHFGLNVGAGVSKYMDEFQGTLDLGLIIKIKSK